MTDRAARAARAYLRASGTLSTTFRGWRTIDAGPSPALVSRGALVDRVRAAVAAALRPSNRIGEGVGVRRGRGHESVRGDAAGGAGRGAGRAAATAATAAASPPLPLGAGAGAGTGGWASEEPPSLPGPFPLCVPDPDVPDPVVPDPDVPGPAGLRPRVRRRVAEVRRRGRNHRARRPRTTKGRQRGLRRRCLPPSQRAARGADRRAWVRAQLRALALPAPLAVGWRLPPLASPALPVVPGPVSGPGLFGRLLASPRLVVGAAALRVLAARPVLAARGLLRGLFIVRLRHFIVPLRAPVAWRARRASLARPAPRRIARPAPPRVAAPVLARAPAPRRPREAARALTPAPA